MVSLEYIIQRANDSVRPCHMQRPCQRQAEVASTSHLITWLCHPAWRFENRVPRAGFFDSDLGSRVGKVFGIFINRARSIFRKFIESSERSFCISLEIMIHDFRFACRQLIKAPGFALAAILVLALGIGANTAVFSLVNAMLFAPPGYAQPHELVQVFSRDKKNPKSFRAFSYPTWLDIRTQNSVFSGVAAHNVGMVGLGEKGNTRRVFVDIVSSDYFAVLRVVPIRGRVFLPEEETGDGQVAIVSYSYWARHN